MIKWFERMIKHSKLIQRLYIIFGSLFVRFLGLFVRQNRRLILFSSFGGKDANDSPRLIFDRIQEKYGATFDYCWALLDPSKIPIAGSAKVKINSLRYFIVALRAKYWVTNVSIERGLRFKKRGCVYLNTWHGVCLDTIGNDRPGRKDYDFRKVNFLCVSSPFDEKTYTTAFMATESQYLRCGMPRNDYLVFARANPSERLRVRKELGLPLDKRIILYAPTWRDNLKTKTDDSFDCPLNLNKWKEKMGETSILLFRAHSITRSILNIHFDDFCIDYSKYPDTSKLLVACDILISDYSSIVIDFSLLERPIYNFGFDYAEYSKNHGFYVDYAAEMPNGIIACEDEIINLLQSCDFEKEKEKSACLRKRYSSYSNGDALNRCVDALLGPDSQGIK